MPPDPAPGLQRSPWAPRVPDAPFDADPPREPTAPDRWKHNLSFEKAALLIGSRGEGADVLQDLGDVLAASDSTQQHVDDLLEWNATASRGKPVSWDGLVQALGSSPERIGDVLSWYARKAIADSNMPPPQEVAAARQYVRQLPVAIRQAMSTPDEHGRLPGNDPRVVRYFATAARQSQPVPANNVLDQISEIEGIMRTDRRRYLKDEAMQGRLRELYRTRDRTK